MPLDSKMLFRRGDEIWGVMNGALDESYIVRYRILTD